MVVDNCSAHPKINLECIELVFLPPNTTSLVQPCDAGIIKNFKGFYKKRLIQHYINALRDNKEVDLDLLDALFWMKLSWEMVSEVTIRNSFRKAGFISDLGGRF